MTQLNAGIASNVIPARAEATLNFRYAPDRTPEDARGARPRARRRRRRDHRRTRRRRTSRSRSPLVERAARRRATSRCSRSRPGRTSPTSRRAASTRSTSAPARRATRTRSTSGSRSRSSSAPTRRCSGSSRVASRHAALPRPRRARAVPVRAARRLEGRRGRARHRADRLRHGRPARGDAGVHPRGAARVRRRGLVVPARDRPAGAARRDRGLDRPPLRRRRRPGDARSCRRSARRRRSSRSRSSRSATKRLVAIPEPAYPVYERGALFAGGAVVTVPLDEETRLAARPRRVRRLGRDRALLGLLPEQPDGRRRAALVLRGARRARARARLPRLLRRGVLGALVRRAARLGARRSPTARTSSSSTRSRSARR